MRTSPGTPRPAAGVRTGAPCRIGAPGRIGALCWIGAAPVLLAGDVVTGLFPQPADRRAGDAIDTLGNVACGTWGATGSPVCPAWHGVMSASAVLTAVLLAAGTVLTARTMGRGLTIRSAQALLLLGALGYALAGRYPADVNGPAHALGALLIMAAGNLGLLVAALAGPAAPATGSALGRLPGVTLLAGLVAVAGTVLLFTGHRSGIGSDDLARVTVLAVPVWALFAGVALLADTRARSAADHARSEADRAQSASSWRATT
jgi:hypothetical protein